MKTYTQECLEKARRCFFPISHSEISSNAEAIGASLGMVGWLGERHRPTIRTKWKRGRALSFTYQAEREAPPEPGSRMLVMSRLPCVSCRWNAKWQERVSQTPIGTRPPLSISIAHLHGAQTCSVGLHEADLCGHLASTTPHNAHVYALPSLSLSVYGWLCLTRSLPSSSSCPRPERNCENRLTESHLSPMRWVTYYSAAKSEHKFELATETNDCSTNSGFVLYKDTLQHWCRWPGSRVWTNCTTNSIKQKQSRE